MMRSKKGLKCRNASRKGSRSVSLHTPPHMKRRTFDAFTVTTRSLGDVTVNFSGGGEKEDMFGLAAANERNVHVSIQ